MASEETESHWVCQVCHEPAPDGIIEIINVNIDLGPIGAHPRQPSPDPHVVMREHLDALRRQRGSTARSEVFSLEDILAAPEPAPNIGLVIRHLACTADKEAQGYAIRVRRARTMELWAGWVLHLARKEWMGRADLMTMLAFWWTHRGEAPPENM